MLAKTRSKKDLAAESDLGELCSREPTAAGRAREGPAPSTEAGYRRDVSLVRLVPSDVVFWLLRCWDARFRDLRGHHTASEQNDVINIRIRPTILKYTVSPAVEVKIQWLSIVQRDDEKKCHKPSWGELMHAPQ